MAQCQHAWFPTCRKEPVKFGHGLFIQKIKRMHSWKPQNPKQRKTNSRGSATFHPESCNSVKQKNGKNYSHESTQVLVLIKQQPVISEYDSLSANKRKGRTRVLLGSVFSRECLDAPAILATFTAGRTGLVACPWRHYSFNNYADNPHVICLNFICFFLSSWKKAKCEKYAWNFLLKVWNFKRKTKSR